MKYASFTHSNAKVFKFEHKKLTYGKCLSINYLIRFFDIEWCIFSSPHYQYNSVYVLEVIEKKTDMNCCRNQYYLLNVVLLEEIKKSN